MILASCQPPRSVFMRFHVFANLINGHERIAASRQTNQYTRSSERSLHVASNDCLLRLPTSPRHNFDHIKFNVTCHR